MKKLFFITANFIWLFCSCSTQELVINTEEVYYKDVNSVNYNYITSPVEAVSYRENQDSTIFGVVVLENGHTVCVSITNPILLQNIIGKDYTYIEKYTIETREIYLKNLSNK